MWRNTSNRQSGRPASRTRTLVPGSSLRRWARTLPAEPPPTMTTSNRCGTGRMLAVQLPDGEAMAAGSVDVRLQPVAELPWPPVREVEPDRRGDRAAVEELDPQLRDVVTDRGISRVAELLDPMTNHDLGRQLGDRGQLRVDLEEPAIVVHDRPGRPGPLPLVGGPGEDRRAVGIPHWRRGAVARELLLGRDDGRGIAAANCPL